MNYMRNAFCLFFYSHDLHTHTQPCATSICAAIPNSIFALVISHSTAIDFPTFDHWSSPIAITKLLPWQLTQYQTMIHFRPIRIFSHRAAVGTWPKLNVKPSCRANTHSDETTFSFSSLLFYPFQFFALPSTHSPVYSPQTTFIWKAYIIFPLHLYQNLLQLSLSSPNHCSSVLGMPEELVYKPPAGTLPEASRSASPFSFVFASPW